MESSTAKTTHSPAGSGTWMSIRKFLPDDIEAVIALWDQVLPASKAWNEPREVIRRRMAFSDDLFFVGEVDNTIVATVIGGYDGTRGWIYSMGVHPDYRRRNIGRRMMLHIESKLQEMGCIKINLQVREGNDSAVSFYESLDFLTETNISMGKPLPPQRLTRSLPSIPIDSEYTLTSMEMSDKPAMVRYLNESDVFSRYLLTVPYPYLESDADQWLTKVLSPMGDMDYCAWAIRDRAGELVGTCGYKDMVPGHKAEIGYSVAMPHWGKGIASRAVQKLCEHLFVKYELAKTVAHVLVGNNASARVLEKCGFEREGLLRRHYHRGGEHMDAIAYGLIQ